jgi:hypothetical protein
MNDPIICFGQQPCGFYPRRFLAAKVRTALRLQAEIGGKVLFFCHDSDHDARETQTILRHRKTGAEAKLNFTFENKVQRKWSPLFLKRVPAGWKETLARQLPAYVEPEAAAAVTGAAGATAADFCLDAYRRLGMLQGIEVVRSSDAALRAAACDIPDYFVDVPYEGEVVRARWSPTALRLHEGGSAYVDLPIQPITKAQISPARDTRLKWMQSVLHCTHYVAGAGEQAYLRPEDAPEIKLVAREPIERSDEAFTELFR